MEDANEKMYRQIEDFLTGNLPEPDAAAIRKRVAQDSAFASEVEFMKFMLAGREVRKPMAVLRNFEKYQRRRTLKIRCMRAAAAVAAMLGLVFLIDFLVREPDAKPELTNIPATSDSTAAEPDQPEISPDTSLQKQRTAPDTFRQKIAPAKTPNQPITQKTSPAPDLSGYLDSRDGISTLGESDDANLQEASALVDEGKGAEALPWLEKYLASLPENKDDVELRIETAKIYLRENNLAQAEFHLQKVLDGGATERFKAEANFYLALKDITVADYPSARKKLEAVVAQQIKPWSEQAAEVLKTLPK